MLWAHTRAAGGRRGESEQRGEAGAEQGQRRPGQSPQHRTQSAPQATATRRIIPAAATGASGLARLLPPQPYTFWATTVLRPLTPEHRHLLDAWLRDGTANAAAGALSLSPGTVRARLGHVTGLLGADLPDAAVRAGLLLALRAPTGGQDSPTPGPYVLGTLSEGILDTEAARTWATGLVGGLQPHLRIALACWLRQRRMRVLLAS
ncbi:helix-turn-helix domain-containing protein [Streptomyces sp. NPDC052069]|uniref:helix-turn-helix domain-containing protein n=1 Tax=Streptomyces sp. NPDC052069 TaxID=3154650 RepID=UPI00341C4A2C